MAQTTQPPLSYQSSLHPTNALSSTTLPSEVITCLKNARFLHLATCDSMFPHVSLMNYTYLPPSASPYTPHPTIIMTTPPASKKTHNLLNNPRVSLLVHDWVSHRPPTATTNTTDLDQSSSLTTEQPTRSSLANLLLNLNSSALSSISTTINGTARIVDQGTEEEAFYKKLHLANNTFGDQAREEQGALGGQGDGGRGCFIEGEEVRVVVVTVRDGRTADWKGGVKDWTVVDVEAGQHGREVLANGA